MFEATSELSRMNRKSANARNLFFISSPRRIMVVLYFIVLRRYRKPVIFLSNRRKIGSVRQLLRLIRSFKGNYRRIRRGV